MNLEFHYVFLCLHSIFMVVHNLVFEFPESVKLKLANIHTKSNLEQLEQSLEKGSDSRGHMMWVGNGDIIKNGKNNKHDYKCVATAKKIWRIKDCGKKLAFVCEKKTKKKYDIEPIKTGLDYTWKINTRRQFQVIVGGGESRIWHKTDELNMQIFDG